MFSVTKIITVALLALSASAIPSPDVPQTNAARMAQGLPPMRPRFINKLPARAPTPVEARAPPVPSNTYTGCIKVTRKSNGAFVGYIDKDWESPMKKRFGVVSSTSSCLKVDTTKPRTGVFELEDTNGPPGMFPFLGWVSSSTSANTLSSSTSTYTLLTLTKHTNAGASASDVGNAYNADSGSQSTIWTFDTGTSVLTSRWINPGGGSAGIQQLYHPGSNVLVQTGNPSGFISTFGTAYEVIYTLV